MSDLPDRAIRRARKRETGHAIDYLLGKSQTHTETFWIGFAVATGLFHAAVWSLVATGFWMSLCAILAGLSLSFVGSLCTVRMAFAPVPTGQRWHAAIPGLVAVVLLSAGWSLRHADAPVWAGWIVIAAGAVGSVLLVAYIVMWCRHNAPTLALHAWQTEQRWGSTETEE